MVLAKENAVETWRNLIGLTNSAEAEEGTIRHEFGDHKIIRFNAVHGSATDHDARREINFFFGREIRLAEKINEIDTKREVS
jgi:nucleoside-diphosphate kinase